MYNNTNVDRNAEKQIDSYYERKHKEIYGDKNYSDNDAYLVYSEFNAIPRKWYEIVLVKSFPVQNIRILPNYSLTDFIIGTESTVTTTGVCIEPEDLQDFVTRINTKVGIDSNNNYYEVLSKEKEYLLYEGDADNYLTCKRLEKYLLNNNPELLSELDIASNKTNADYNNIEKIIYQTWEFFKENMKIANADGWIRYALSTIPNNKYGIIWNVSVENYQNFNSDCLPYKEISLLVDRKKKFKETPIALYGQIYRLIKHK